jgi:IS605 OrfB family transposase
MQLSLQTQLRPTPEQGIVFDATMRRFNQAAEWLAGVAFEARCASKYTLQKLHYGELRARFGISAQMAVRCCAQVAAALKRDRSIRPHFRPHAAVPYDARILSRKGGAVSMLTLGGRTLVPMVWGEWQRRHIDAEWGECDLVRRHDGRWFLLVGVEVPDGEGPLPTEFLGVDLGLANIAATSDGMLHTGELVERIRRSYAEKRRRLQIKAAQNIAAGKRPKAARRKLKAIARKEARFRKDVNHCIFKSLVTLAKDTGRGIALDLLTHIRGRTRFRKAQRARMSGWSFAQLRSFIEYKAVLVGVLAMVVSPRNTSRQCFACKRIDKANRRLQSEFACVACGHADHADINAAKNISYRAAVSLPIVSMLVRLRELALGPSLGVQAEVA